MAGVSGLGLAYATAGGVLLWAGLKGQTVAQTVKAIVSGNSSALSAKGQTVSGPVVSGSYTPSGSSSPGNSSATSTPVTATGSTIADDAMKYQGHPYLYGGAPGTSGTDPWDCSSFCNWVLGHDLGMTLPGASSPGYSGTSHGPNTVLYLAWSRAQTVSHSSSAAQAGDLCVWQTHMGIAIGNGKMISALNESLGTRVTPIDGQVTGEVLFVRRIIIGNQAS